ncbi:MAG TPA: ferritin family protein [Planctomycetes bacterium]|nr:ferritin family protein [Planctomycetota bacterium]
MEEFESDEEILQFAIGRETSSYQFYTDLAQEMENPMMKLLFENFAKEELRHKAMLELELMKRGLVVPEPVDTDDLDQTDVMVAIDPETGVDYKNALVLAINKEEKSFRLYIELAAMVKDKNSRETLLSLAQDEAKHELQFEIEYGAVTKGK